MTGTQQRTDLPTRRRLPWFLEFYRSAVGKKWVMATTGIVLISYIVAHMIGNLKIYIGPEAINTYGESLRDLGGHLVPRTHLLWILRIGLIAAALLHLHAALTLALANRRSRPARYEERHYAVANYASRTMVWGGLIILAFLIFHLADLTWGNANPDYFRGDVYGNVVASFERLPVAVLYIVANVVLGIHIFHGAWSMFQSLGVNNPRFNQWRRWLAIGLAGVVVVGNVSFPIAVQLGILG